jgi:hypothetical protein
MLEITPQKPMAGTHEPLLLLLFFFFFFFSLFLGLQHSWILSISLMCVCEEEGEMWRREKEWKKEENEREKGESFREIGRDRWGAA